jgi:O-acetyl-ADP-ribose deacetylase (regulator of RNase III)
MRIVERQGGCPPGEAVITMAGKLPARHVIHTVGPVWHGGMNNEDQLLTNAYNNSLRLAVENGAKTVAFPNISTGVYGFPKERAARIAIEAVRKFLKSDKTLNEVVFVCFDRENFEIYERLLK